MKKLLSVLDDYVFKLIFGDMRNIDILTDFLKAVLDLPENEYESITIIDPYLKRESQTAKTGILDVKITTTSGKVINVEIQAAPTPEMAKRVVFYAAGMLREQLRRGEAYEELAQVICILITGYVLLPEEPDYRNEISLRVEGSGKEFTNVMRIVILELPKLPVKDEREVWSWLRFMKAESEEELMQVAHINPKLKKPIAVLKKLSASEREQMLEEKRWMRLIDEGARLKGAYTEGLSLGEERGRERGFLHAKRETARNLKTMGLTAEQIAAATGLSFQEIDNISV